ncbi:flagellar basal body P-ring formation chaperone FlgA [Hydrogenophaga sp.]|uniref:flagellar basal body P-ring formation chaperone FlgA n=1 Tax=Hydrogenophaga sp. TaxID=1904254 RepID=UPI0025C3F292|nr:flagellar basal body P-ring formation chaperone FlgA [Hydrogenophaga sp.]
MRWMSTISLHAPSIDWRLWLCLGLVGGTLMASPARANEPGAEGSAQLERVARDFLQPSVEATMGQSAESPLRAEVVVGSLDQRLRLAPCSQVEPHLPGNTRLWGRARIGLRCVEGTTRWNVYLPVTVKAWGPAWVLKRPVNAGEVLTQEDAEQAEVDWAEHPASILANQALWVGQQAAYTLLPGQALRQNMVRPVQAFAAGSQVRVTQSGTGFQVVVSGKALSSGMVGQTTRVRLDNGRVVTGLVRDGQTVELSL